MQLSAANLELIRSQPQSTELYLSIFQPRTIFQARINDIAITRGERIISFDTVTLGGYLSIESGMTMLIGTSLGARDLGKIRIKSVTSSQLTVSENSHIAWADNLYLTVLRYFEVWPVYPRIIPDPANPEEVIFYKDYDDAYTNQNSILGAFPCAGNHKAAFVGEQVYWSASGTTALIGGNTLSYDWAFEGGTSITGSASHTPGYVTYNTPGHYITRLVITGINGSVDTTYRYVSIYNRPENNTLNIPIKNWELQSIGGSRGEGGNRASIKVIQENISIYDGDVVVIFADDWYGGTNTSLGGNALNNSKIFFAGHILGDSILFDYQSSSVDFEAGNISALMKTIQTFAISLETSAAPTTWFQMIKLDGKRGIYHYLKYNSTALFLADFEFVGTDRLINYFDTDRESIFDGVDNYMRNTLLGSLVSDRQGKLWAEVDAMAYSNPTGSFPTVMSIARADWMGEPSIQERLSDEVSFIEVGGVAYSGPITGTFQAFLSQAPGSTPGGKGQSENIPGLAIAGQSQLNTLSGNVLANRNSRYPMVNMGMTAGFRNLDIAPQNTVFMDILASDTNSGAVIHAPYIVDGMNWTYDKKNKILLPDIDLTSLVNGQAGTTITIPEIPDDGGFDSGGGGFNPIAFPPAIPLSAVFWKGAGSFSTLTLFNSTVYCENLGYLSGESALVTKITSNTYTINQSGVFLFNLSSSNLINSLTYLQITINGFVLSDASYEVYLPSSGNLKFGSRLFVASIQAGTVFNLAAGFVKTTSEACIIAVYVDIVKIQ